MKYQQDLQIRLQERYRRLYKADSSLYSHEAGYLVAFIRGTAALRYLIESIERSDPELDPAKWVENNFGYHKAAWPATEEGRSKVSWHLLQNWAAGQGEAGMFGHTLDPSENNLSAGARKATETVVEPLIEFLQERIGEGSDILYILERYIRRVEWFERSSLHERFLQNKRRGEAVYDQDLRQFLFEQGVDYPFSQPRSASGESDVVASLEGDDPLVCEVKLFDAANYSKSYLAKGANQAVSYARDYGKAIAYLVVFNLSEKILHLPTDGAAGDWPPRVDVAGVTLFLLQVRALPRSSASSGGAAEVFSISKKDLLREEGGDSE